MMKRLHLLALIPSAVLLTMVVAVQLAASRAERAQPQADLDMMITMPSGGSRPLREVLARLEPRAAASETKETPPSVRPDPLRRDEERGEDVVERAFDLQVAGEVELPTLCELAEQRFRAGDLAQARALYASVAPDEPGYSLAQRRIGWEIQTKLDGDPLAGVGSVNRSLRADPMDGNAWQDASRVYVESLASVFRFR